jgi:integrase
MDEMTTRRVLDGYLSRQWGASEAGAEGALRENTLRELERFLPRLIETEMADGTRLGDLIYAEVRPSDLKAALQAFRYSPGRPRNGKPGQLPAQATTKNVTAYCRMFFKDADLALRLDRASPMLAVKTADVVGRRQREQRTYLTDEQVEFLLEEVTAHYRPIVTLLSETGLRSGEARGLLWGDMEPDGFHVTAQAAREGHGRVETKTASSKRFVAYTTRSRAVVEAQHQWVTNTYGPGATAADKPVFPTRTGRFIGATNLTHCVSEAAQRAGLPPTSAHSLRHYAAKRLMRNGVSVDVVAAVVGHSSVTTTTSIYSDATATPEEKAEAMRRAFG